MDYQIINKALNILIALVWVINGLFCKVLNMVPRHQEIVAEILGKEYAHELTLVIGTSEIGMAAWVLSNIYSRINALTQITIVLVMNVLEFWLVPDLLLWGKFNIIFAILFAVLVYCNEFLIKPKWIKALRHV